MTGTGFNWVGWVVQSTAAAATVPILVFLYRSLARRVPPAAKFLAFGLILRGVLGAGLFFASYLEMPFLSALHTGDGFWELAPDARMYYDAAVGGVDHGLSSIGSGAPSPAFIRALSIWMMAVGVSPASGSLLNICCYLVVCLLLVRFLLPRVDAAALAVATFTLSPSLLVFGTQPLKDMFFATLVVCLCIAARRLLSEPGDDVDRRWWLASLVAALAMYLVAGIRTYYALFLWGGLSLVLGGTAIWAWRKGFRRATGRAAAVVVVCALAVVAGSGSYLGVLVSQFSRAPARAEQTPVLQAVQTLDQARLGFVSSGGGTNLGGEIAIESAGGRLQAVGLGTLLLTVPVSLLEWLDVVDVPGGRGLLVVADLDTLFIDASVIAVIILLVRASRRQRLNLPYVAFILVVSLATAISLAYVVTNFGTLFRLRLMAVVPLWMLPFALIGKGSRGLVEAQDRPLPALVRRPAAGGGLAPDA